MKKRCKDVIEANGGHTKMVACNLDLKPAYKVTPASQERHHTNETYA